MNYFELFDLPQGPAVNRQMLTKKYTELQKRYHPDFSYDLNEVEKEEALDTSSHVNKAYKIFTDPDRTIEYFLHVSGLIGPDEKYALPADFLMEMMEMNERLTEDSGDEVIEDAKEYASKLEADIKPVIDSYWMGVTDGPSLQKLKAYYYKKKYLKRLLERTDD